MKVNRKAVRVFSLLLVLLASVLAMGSFSPASADTQQAISQKVKKFYGWYVARLSKDKSPMDNRAMIRNHSSRRLWKWLNSKAYGEYGADYFLAAQDFGRDWGTNLKISNFKTKGKVVTLTLRLGRTKPEQTEIGPHTIKLKLVKESGAWKIDRVNGN